METHYLLDRRHFLSSAVLGTCGAMVLGQDALAAATDDEQRPICCFAKALQHLSFDEMAERVAEMGFQGIEATIRNGGQVEPADITTGLPQLVQALQKRGLDVTIMTSDINSVDQEDTQRVLSTAADLGIKRYRMRYFTYDFKKPLRPQIEALKPQFAKLAALNHRLGMTALYQNHSGAKYVGAPVWDVYEAIKDLPPEDMAIAFDIRHATVEGGLSWPLEFHLVQSHLGAIYVKDYQWEGSKVVNVPIGEGRVDPVFFTMLKESRFEGPISLHMEYIDHKDPALQQASLEAVAKDMQALKKLLASA